VILLAAGFISGGASAGPAPDRERVARGSCPDTLCVFTADNYSGTQVDVTKLGVSNKVDKQIPDQAASLINDRGSAAIFYEKRDGKGRAICINLGDGLTDLQEVQLSGFDSTRLIRGSCAAVLP
jgi:Peptidase inhibitor family I36